MCSIPSPWKKMLRNLNISFSIKCRNSVEFWQGCVWRGPTSESQTPMMNPVLCWPGASQKRQPRIPACFHTIWLILKLCIPSARSWKLLARYNLICWLNEEKSNPPAAMVAGFVLQTEILFRLTFGKRINFYARMRDKIKVAFRVTIPWLSWSGPYGPCFQQLLFVLLSHFIYELLS